MLLSEHHHLHLIMKENPHNAKIIKQGLKMLTLNSFQYEPVGFSIILGIFVILTKKTF